MMPVLVALMVALSFLAGWLIGYDYCKTKWSTKIDLFRNEKIKAEHVADLLRKELNKLESLELARRFNEKAA